MNQYGRRMMRAWSQRAPERVAQMENPDAFFTQLGQEVEGQILSLSAQLEANSAGMLATGSFSEETYLQDVARRMTARRIAEEVVMNQLAWISDPALPLDEAREEWNQTSPSIENLIRWAERMQDAPDLMPSTADLEQKAKDWAVPVEFLEGMVQAEIPRAYLNEHQAMLDEAATIRFLRELH
ncbi:hypothetical protein [Microbacterium panaciterrae]|uniref:Uncharacterized protein n=1 Tax=Microbacterium panaciterrae TaxID=985759 RepID=A0ABP8PG35_9MICO